MGDNTRSSNSFDSRTGRGGNGLRVNGLVSYSGGLSCDDSLGNEVVEDSSLRSGLRLSAKTDAADRTVDLANGTPSPWLIFQESPSQLLLQQGALR